MNSIRVLLLLCVLLFVSCKKESGCNDPNAVNFSPDAEKNDGSCRYPLTISQIQFDTVSTNRLKIYNGFQPSIDSSFGHAPGVPDPTKTIREIFGNVHPVLQKGDLVVKKVYARDSLGNKGLLLKIFAMYKQEPGYFAAGGDWEYFVLDSTQANPNGQLSAQATRGKLEYCSTCHRAATGNDFLFYR